MITVERSNVGGPRCVSRVDDDDVVVIGLAHLFDPDADRVVVAELDANTPITDDVDVARYDSFAQPESDDIAVLVENPHARHVAVYTWSFAPTLIATALHKDAHGYLSKTMPARDLVAAIEAVAAGEIVVSNHHLGHEPPRASTGPDGPNDSPTAKRRCSH